MHPRRQPDVRDFPLLVTSNVTQRLPSMCADGADLIDCAVDDDKQPLDVRGRQARQIDFEIP